jgi:hypothetical protein
MNFLPSEQHGGDPLLVEFPLWVLVFLCVLCVEILAGENKVQGFNTENIEKPENTEKSRFPQATIRMKLPPEKRQGRPMLLR